MKDYSRTQIENAIEEWIIGKNAERDSMGRYSRERGYSRDDDFRSELQELIQDAPNEHIRQKMQMIMSEM